MRFASEGNAPAPLNSMHSRSLPALTAIALLSALSAATLTGCGIGKIDTSSSEVAQVIPAFKGSMMGGQSPIINATVKIYTTGTATNCAAGSTGNCTATDTNYGVGTFLQEATQKGSSAGQDTDVSGNFSFPGGYRCPAGEFAYIVGSGGQPGSTTMSVNSNILLVAALGRCEDLYNPGGGGANYTSAPTVGFTNATGDTTGSGASATATVTGGDVTGVNLNSGGTGYTASPTVSFTGGGGSGASAVATMSVNAVTVGSPGSNYTAAPTVTFSGGGGSGAAATATEVGGGVTTINITNAGSGYTSAPTVTLTPAPGDTTGNGATATATLQVAAVTVPSPSYTGSSVVVNEITTVAAGYALGNFASVTNSGTPSTTQVLIGAPSTNNAPKVNGYSTGTTTAAAGLYHAFLNAANLANPFSLTTLNTAPTTAAGNVGAVVPAALINTIANILANCVDSAGTGGQCSNLPSPNTDTFSAVKALAANPTLGGNAQAVATLYNSQPTTAQFSPTLSNTGSTSIAGFNDFSIAINYPSSTFTAISFPMSGALDLNDDYFVGNATYNAGNPGAGVKILGFTSSGAYSASVTIPNNESAAYSLALDSNGNGYIGNGGGSATYALGIFTTSGGTIPTAVSGSVGNSSHASGGLKTYALAVDKANNVWALGVVQSNGTSNLYKSPGPFVAGSKTFVAQDSPNAATGLPIPNDNQVGLAIDPNQNVWIGTGQNIYVLENTAASPLVTPTYPATTVTFASTAATGNPVSGFAFTGTASATTAWIPSYNTVPGVQLFTPTYDAAGVGVTSITGSTIATPSTVTGTLATEADGAGTVWLADTNSSSIQAFNTAASTAYRFLPCQIASGTTCSSVFSYKPLSLSIDSTGSIWASIAASGSTNGGAGNIVEIIGSAAPTWPLLSLGKIGKP